MTKLGELWIKKIKPHIYPAIWSISSVLLIIITLTMIFNLTVPSPIEEITKIVIQISIVIVGFSFIALSILVREERYVTLSASSIKEKEDHKGKLGVLIDDITTIISFFIFLIVVSFLLFLFNKIPSNQIFVFFQFFIERGNFLTIFSILLYFCLLIGFFLIFDFMKDLRKYYLRKYLL